MKINKEDGVIRGKQLTWSEFNSMQKSAIESGIKPLHFVDCSITADYSISKRSLNKIFVNLFGKESFWAWFLRKLKGE